MIYALHVEDNVQHVAGLIYAGAAIGAVFAGDLITLFVYWELTAISSVFLIWASRTERAYRAGMRYLIIQVGIRRAAAGRHPVHCHDTGSIAFGHSAREHRHEPDLPRLRHQVRLPAPAQLAAGRLPRGDVTGTVFLSAFTTKLASTRWRAASPAPRS